MKKLLTAILVVTIVLAMAAPAFAAEANGTITINGIGADATYAIYKVLDLESYDAAQAWMAEHGDEEI